MQETREVTFAPGLLTEDVFSELKNLGKEYMRLMSYYSSAMLEIETKFKVLNIEFNGKFDRNPIENIKTRLKTPKSIIEKMDRIGVPVSAKNIERELSDVAGVRVICSFVDDIYRLADMLALQDDVYILKTKDYIKNPKPSGYRSLHLIVEVPIFLSQEKRFMRVEVQLRTIAMDFWASLEHKLRYKKDIPQEHAQEIARQLIECAETVSRTDQQMLDIRRQIEESGR
ncbi:MAG: GTP pyrophosphokinase family protein [Clostridiales bacterium]|nr:GTP pyrophosphokinase family protein [Clostridiales bacterium]MDY5349356.1 GTP pyrophosphokinase family protein [Candidatus Ventricola sp.]MDY5515558.1 GTP pyrophosphokinase family protein [Candidatus Ventricola sp.]